MSIPGMYSFLSKSTENSKNSFFWSSVLLRKDRAFRGHALPVFKGPNFFLYNMGFMGTNSFRSQSRFQKYKLTLVTKLN
jgi:hypothetical protein